MKKGGVIGRNIQHSLSPMIHNHSFLSAGLDYVYEIFDWEESEFSENLPRLRQPDFFGANVTMPYKEAVIPFLDKISDRAERIGAVNTIVNIRGQLIGENTDGEGFILATRSFFQGLLGKKVVVLGAGGAAKAVVSALVEHHAEVVVVSRTGANFQKMVARIGKERVLTFKSFEGENKEYHLLRDADLIVNATNSGMSYEKSLVDFSKLSNNKLCVMDLIYSPEETHFLQQAKANGLRAKNGLDMLVFQASLAFTLWTGVEMDVPLIQNKLKGNL
ncbi:MAG: shikimate dehydrogenase [Streptococcaceae bacterium]|jgi:shikimate dehydrogenase|nr:shikimate dehydrogenase [Streptococcaceae bacterium]